MEFIAVSRSRPTPKHGNRMPMPRSKPSMTTYMNTANARIAAQTLVSTVLSTMARLLDRAAGRERRSRRDARGVRRCVRHASLVRLRRLRHEPEQVPGAHAEHGEIDDDE